MIFLARYWREIGFGALVAALLALIAVNARVLSERDAARIERDALEQQVVALTRDTAAREAASVQRVQDAEQNAANEKDRTDAIQAAAPGATGPSTRALACLRWTRAHPGSAAPSACR